MKAINRTTVPFSFPVIVYLIILLCVPAFAHQDKIIEMKNGELIGLPEKYRPAYFDLKEKTLQLGQNRIKFPDCVSKYFPENNDYEIQFTASWYHNLSILPPYLNIFIQPKGKVYSYNLLFDMDTLKPYQFEMQIRDSEILISYHELKIDESCQDSIEKARTRIERK